MRVVAVAGVPALLIGALAWPLLFSSAAFTEDWMSHLWFIWNQSMTIRHDHLPSLFLNYSHSVFYPEYAFYGGTLYAMAGALSLALGEAPIVAYVASYLLGFLAAYGGWYWMARMSRLGHWWAHLPGVVFITSAYYLTLVYARGDLQEFLGVSMIPPMVASGLSLLRARRMRFGPALALAASSVLFFGSHNLTIVWGSALMALTAGVALACIPATRLWLTWRSVLRVGALLVPALLVSAWFLLPAVAYQSHTLISSTMAHWESVMRELMYLVSAGNLFTISRAPAIGVGTDFALSLPVLAMAWSLLCIFICWRRGSGLREAWARLLLVCAGMTAFVIVVMTHAGLVLALPRPFAILQYTYRLESYVALLVSGAVLAGLAMAQHAAPRRRRWRWVLVPVALVAIVGAIQQTAAYPRGGNRNSAIASLNRTGFGPVGLGDYLDAKLPLRVDPYGKPVTITFPPTAVQHDRISQAVHLQPHQWVYTNIGGGPELVHVSGAKIIGRNLEGNDVLEIGPSVGAAGSKSANGRGSVSTEVISVSGASSWPVVLGRVLSLVGLVVLACVFATLGARRLAGGADRRHAARAR